MVNNQATNQQLWRENAMLNDLLSQVANSKKSVLTQSLELRLSRWKRSTSNNNKSFTVDHVAQIRHLRTVEKMTDAQIAVCMGRTGTAIRDLCLRQGIPNLYRFNCVFTEQQLRDAVIFREKGCTWKETASLLDISESRHIQLRRAVKKHLPAITAKP